MLSDGEYRRGGWASDFQDAMDGYVPGTPPVVMTWHSPASNSHARGAGLARVAAVAASRVIGAKLRQTPRLTAARGELFEVARLGSVQNDHAGRDVRRHAGLQAGRHRHGLASRTRCWQDAADIIAAEIQALIAEGVPYIQLDNPHYPDYISDDRRDQWRSLGIDPDQALRDDIAADNASIPGLERLGPRSACTCAAAMGRSDRWHTEGGYERIAEQVFGGIDVDRFLLEYDSERAGGFEPLRFMPRDKMVVLGLITTKSGRSSSRRTTSCGGSTKPPIRSARRLALSPSAASPRR